jgi:hypothetical protein
MVSEAGGVSDLQLQSSAPVQGSQDSAGVGGGAQGLAASGKNSATMRQPAVGAQREVATDEKPSTAAEALAPAAHIRPRLQLMGKPLLALSTRARVGGAEQSASK